MSLNDCSKFGLRLVISSNSTFTAIKSLVHMGKLKEPLPDHAPPLPFVLNFALSYIFNFSSERKVDLCCSSVHSKQMTGGITAKS